MHVLLLLLLLLLAVNLQWHIPQALVETQKQQHKPPTPTVTQETSGPAGTLHT
jgi:hypothetical protein